MSENIDRPVNSVGLSFNTIMGQMTNCLSEKKRASEV